MANQTGNATDLADLVAKLFTFATGNGWTQDLLNTGAGKAAMHKGTVYVSFRWDPSTPLALGIYQALGYTGGNDPGTHPDDSGNGAVSGSNSFLIQERSIADIGNGAFPSYYFFLDSGYLHVVAETSSTIFRHFGFGTILKTGDWTGGEYCYGQVHDANLANSNQNSALLDGLFSQSAGVEKAATVHVEGMPGQSGSSKWGIAWGSTTSLPNDTGGNPRINLQGGFEGGPISRQFAFYSGGSQSGLIPQYPISCWYRNPSTNFVYFLGYMPDMRGVNLKSFAAKDEIVIGSDTWVVFPTSEKTTSAVSSRSYNQGIAYKKVP